MFRKLFIFALIFFILSSCDDEKVGTPKPRTYPRVEFPVKDYTFFNPEKCNFTFEYPKYAKIIHQNSFFNKKTPNDCWYNVTFPKYNGELYLTYYPIKNRKEFEKLIDDSFVLTSKHDTKASSRNEIKILNKNAVGGILFKVNGAVASQTQFFLTDTTSNFIRGALYFNNKVNVDSMQVIQAFIDEDISHIINTFNWK